MAEAVREKQKRFGLQHSLALVPGVPGCVSADPRGQSSVDGKLNHLACSMPKPVANRRPVTNQGHKCYQLSFDSYCFTKTQLGTTIAKKVKDVRVHNIIRTVHETAVTKQQQKRTARTIRSRTSGPWLDKRSRMGNSFPSFPLSDGSSRQSHRVPA